jgi:hypothetical protein
MKFALFSLPRSVATFMEDATVVVAGFSVRRQVEKECYYRSGLG